jgi:hypothetical protein
MHAWRYAGEKFSLEEAVGVYLGLHCIFTCWNTTRQLAARGTSASKGNGKSTWCKHKTGEKCSAGPTCQWLHDRPKPKVTGVFICKARGKTQSARKVTARTRNSTVSRARAPGGPLPRVGGGNASGRPTPFGHMYLEKPASLWRWETNETGVTRCMSFRKSKMLLVYFNDICVYASLWFSNPKEMMVFWRNLMALG